MAADCQLHQQASESAIGHPGLRCREHQAGIRAEVSIRIDIQNVENAVAQADIQTGVITAAGS